MSNQHTIMLVEDNEGDIELIKEAFSSMSIKNSLKVCTNGEQAINFLNAAVAEPVKFPILILLDINLPKVDGKEVLFYLKNDPKLKRIPVLILSSSALPVDIAYAYDNHANGYIVKPSNLMDFTRTIKCIEMFWIDCVIYPKIY